MTVTQLFKIKDVPNCENWTHWGHGDLARTPRTHQVVPDDEPAALERLGVVGPLLPRDGRADVPRDVGLVYARVRAREHHGEVEEGAPSPGIGVHLEEREKVNILPRPGSIGRQHEPKTFSQFKNISKSHFGSSVHCQLYNKSN